MYLKRRVRKKDGKEHVYYSVCESLRVHGGRTVQRQMLHLGELNTAQCERWQRTLEIVREEDGARLQRRLFTDREGAAPSDAQDVIELRLSTLRVSQPRRFGDCWAGCRLWRDLGLDKFWSERLATQSGAVRWEKVLELLAVNRLLDPRSELFIHEKWFSQTAMDVLLDCDCAVAEKDRLYRCLDHLVEHKAALEEHLAGKWKDLFGASFDIVLYDLTSTYFEGSAKAIPKARRGYSRDHRPDCKQLVIALVVTAEGFPLTYEIFPGNTIDATTLQDIVATMENKHGAARRVWVWVFDRGVTSEENLKWLRERGAHYLVGTPKSHLRKFEQHLTETGWAKAAPEVEVKLCPADEDIYVLCRSRGRVAKEHAMRGRALRACVRDLVKLRRLVAHGRLKDADAIQQRLGGIRERHRATCRFLKTLAHTDGKIVWEWDRQEWRAAVCRDGAYLLRAHWPDQHDSAQLWNTYIQLTEAEAAFRSLKSELRVRPIWHWKEPRVEAHILVAFLGYAMWVCLKKHAAARAPALTPWQILQHLRAIVLVDVEFDTCDGRTLTLPRITVPEKEQAALLLQMGWTLPQQPPPRIRPPAPPTST